MVDVTRDNMSVRQEKAVLVGVSHPDHKLDDKDPLNELRGLVTTAGAKVAGELTQTRQKPDLATCLGKGKVEELVELVNQTDANVVVFDNELDPAQGRNLEKALDKKVLDRTELVLDIFATRARTMQARLQVELAQLEYARPRLKRMWSHLERHGGGIGTRGPGEQQLETDRRLVSKKIRDLKTQLNTLQQRKHREVENRDQELRVSLVGYTNAGKSTLMRALTGSDVYVANKLFATLDTRTRQWTLPGWGKVLISDTVGFIRYLPHNLVESFKATLEESIHAHLLLHVVDASSPHAAMQIQAVNTVLEEIEARDKPTILVLNKIDEVEDPTQITALENRHPHTVAVSAHKERGLDDLRQKVCQLLTEHFVDAKVQLHAGNGKLLAYLSAHGHIMDRDYIEQEQVVITLRMAKHLLDRIDSAEARVLILEHPPVIDPSHSDTEYPPNLSSPSTAAG